MSKNEFIAQNLQETRADDVKVIYIYPQLVVEVSPAMRRVFQEQGRIYLRYSSCKFADHVWIMQCYRCLAFGHLARDCKGAQHCGHCAKAHETKDCANKNQLPRCHNCLSKNNVISVDIKHSATDAERCPILSRKIKDRIANTDYGQH